MTKRSRTLGRWALLAAFVFLLTGCLKLDMQLDVQADDTVNGSVVFAVNKDVLSMTGGSFEDLIGDQGVPFPSDIEGVTTEEYDDGEFVGQQYTFEGVALGEFNSDPADPDGLRITHEGDTFVVDGVLTCRRVSRTERRDRRDRSARPQMMGSAQPGCGLVPGRRHRLQRQIDGTRRLQPKFGERQSCRRRHPPSRAARQLDAGVHPARVAAVAIIAAIVVLMNCRRRRPRVPWRRRSPSRRRYTPSGEATADAAGLDAARRARERPPPRRRRRRRRFRCPPGR
jgi:hypothetical protein